jgi:hypothetical protein
VGALLSWINAAELPPAEISTTSEANGLGIRSVLTPQIADVWRSGAVSTGAIIRIRVDLGLVRTDLRFVGVAAPADGVLPGADAKMRFVASAIAVDGEEAANSGLLPMDMRATGVWGWVAPSTFTARYLQWRIQVGAADTYIQLGRLWAGPALVSSRGISYGQARGAIDAGSSEVAGLSGVRYATRGAVRRKASWAFPALLESEADALDDAARAVGTTGQVFAAPFQERLSKTGMFGHFTTPPAPAASRFQRWSADIDIEEDL